MSNIQQRAFSALNLNQYSQVNKPDKIRKVKFDLPQESQMILRMLIKNPYDNYQLPKEVDWMDDLLFWTHKSQKNIGINQPFVYLTIRHGIANFEKDDEWHADGFSTNVTHLPEQNYVWVNKIPTEYVEQSFDFPKDFDPRIHNIHWFLEERVRNENIRICDPETIYCFDPYVVHRRPKVTQGIFRTFIRITYCPMEINDANNTINPLIETNYKRDGVKSFRDKLAKYESQNF